LNPDVVVIGGGPVGCVAALAFAARGASVLVLEANPRAASRLAGEWLHPPAVSILTELGVDVRADATHTSGRGFVVFGDDGREPIPLPYARGAGHSMPHEHLAALLRRRLATTPGIEFREHTRAVRIAGQEVTLAFRNGAPHIVRAGLIVGATGRSDMGDAELAQGPPAHLISRMAGVVLRDVELPCEGYGHVFLGGLGPILGYRIGESAVRLCLDVPLSLASTPDRAAVLFDGYAAALPERLRKAFRESLLLGRPLWATNQTRARERWGRPGLALVGDSVGHHHPLTAIGMTLGFQDARTLAENADLDEYRRLRSRASRVPEMLALALYDVFAGTRDDLVAIRRAVYDLWRTRPATRDHTMRLLACEATHPAAAAAPFLRAAGVASKRVIGAGLRTTDLRHTGATLLDLGSETRWFLQGAFSRGAVRPAAVQEPRRAGESSSAGQSGAAGDRTGTGAGSRALQRGVSWLLAQQDASGSFEGECVWCAMLAAQYVLTWHILGLPIDDVRRRRLLLHFERTRLKDGLWGLSEVTPASLFVTTLVYCAARILGVSATDPLLERARRFIVRQGGVQAIPTWGKFWLSLLSLYDWSGINPIPPELWLMPRSSPIHPSRYYCHTRLIYLAMATLYGERFQHPLDEVTRALRSELYPQGYSNVDFAAARSQRRPEDLYAPVGLPLELTYAALRRLERFGARRARSRALAGARSAIRWELSVSNHTSISPVSGLLNILALWSADPADGDARQAIANFDAWLWEDDRDGTRVTGARSAIWDTSFALQALTQALPHVDVRDPMKRAGGFLAEQQIRESFAGWQDNARIDPNGGYPFSRRLHGWPVSDCTAEAMIAALECRHARPSDDDVVRAAAFVLRTQGAGGGFGSYEPPRTPVSLEWLNPAEMFGNSMTEHEYVECTASALALFSAIGRHRSALLRRAELADLPRATQHALGFLRNRQQSDGAWTGAWGVYRIYGTLFGIRGLCAAGVPRTDRSIRKACEWLKSHQRSDGSWSERRDFHSNDYVEHERGQVVQTSWALMALLEAGDPSYDAMARAAGFLASAQLGNGEWPREQPTGVFFETALLDYALYRSYFPIWALAAFETRRKQRADLAVAPEESASFQPGLVAADRATGVEHR
jgi:lanosterol synthase